MLKRNDIGKEKFKSPGICYYKPKYNLIEKKLDNVVPFKIIKKPHSPQYKIQKLWRSYKVFSEYSLVNI